MNPLLDEWYAKAKSLAGSLPIYLPGDPSQLRRSLVFLKKGCARCHFGDFTTVSQNRCRLTAIRNCSHDGLNPDDSSLHWFPGPRMKCLWLDSGAAKSALAFFSKGQKTVPLAAIPSKRKMAPVCCSALPIDFMIPASIPLSMTRASSISNAGASDFIKNG